MSTIPSPYVRKASRIDPGDKERLILEYAPTIKYIAQRIAARLPPHIGLDDLINAGVIGLIDAIAKYDSSRDNTFKTYAEFRIRGAMLDELRSLDWVPRSVRQKESALSAPMKPWNGAWGVQPATRKLQNFSASPLEEFHEWLNQVRGASLLSLETPGLRASDGETLNLLDLVSTDEAQSPAQLVQARRLKALIAEAVDDLPYQEKVVISLYYYEELTMKEIGKVLEITESRVSQIHTKSIFHLRSKLKVLLQE